MSEELRLNITSDPANLAEARRAVEELCARHGFSAAAGADLGLCVNEAVANVIRHAYGGAKDRPIRIDATVESRASGAIAAGKQSAVELQVRVQIRDWGNGVDPRDLPENAKPKDPLKPGGLGLICMQRMLDEFEFRPQTDGMLLEMVKRRAVE
ncbi:MAG TPA: ATP-binding protein [Tepidisphaeraceae bacterium]|nr:ATP-binding protein [Tepidisphaeraceae bacterium]